MCKYVCTAQLWSLVKRFYILGSCGLLFQIHGKLTSLTSAGVISALKAIFSHNGIRVEFRSDNGLQFTSQ